MSRQRCACIATSAVLLLLLAMSVGCNGEILGAPAGPDSEVESDSPGKRGEEPGTSGTPATGEPLRCESPRPDETPLRVLTRTEYVNTVQDLLGIEDVPLTVAPSSSDVGFDNDALALSVSPRLIADYQHVAEELASTLRGRLGDLLPCDAEAVGERECAVRFIRHFGRRAYRRPLDSAQLAALEAMYEAGAARGGFARGILDVIEATLQSPWFLYHVELGEPSEAGAESTPLTDWEIASRLSYFLWNTMPDEELLQAAERGALSSPDDIEAQARRMFDDPRARDSIRNFHRQWLELDELDELEKNPEKAPGFDEALRHDLKEETLAFLDAIVLEGGDVQDMFVSSFSMMNERVAGFYGLSGVTGEKFQRVELDDTRAGLLTHASLMAINAKSSRTSPIHRGLLVRTKILCDQLPPPPPDVPPLAEADASLTERERLARHREDPACKGCHRLMDPIGFAFEHFGADGSYRSTGVDGGPVDATGEIVATRDADGKVDGAKQLSARLARSGQVRECVAKQWFRYALGRTERREDACALQGIMEEFEQDGFRLRALIMAIVRSETFRLRQTVEAAGDCR